MSDLPAVVPASLPALRVPPEIGAALIKSGVPDEAAARFESEYAVLTMLYPAMPAEEKALCPAAIGHALTDLVPEALRYKPAAVLAHLAHAARFGFTGLAAFQAFHNMGKGRIMPAAATCRALALAAGYKMHWIEDGSGGSGRATVVLVAPDGQIFPQFSFTLEDAATAGLLGNQNYKKHPAAMLRARATTGCCTLHIPHVVGVAAPAEDVLEDVLPEGPAFEGEDPQWAADKDRFLARLERAGKTIDDAQAVLNRRFPGLTVPSGGQRLRVQILREMGLLPDVVPAAVVVPA